MGHVYREMGFVQQEPPRRNLEVQPSANKLHHPLELHQDGRAKEQKEKTKMTIENQLVMMFENLNRI
jgi:hypothetical protein